MKSIKSVLETEAIFSQDKMHRYLLKKTWDIDRSTYNYNDVSSL